MPSERSFKVLLTLGCVLFLLSALWYLAPSGHSNTSSIRFDKVSLEDFNNYAPLPSRIAQYFPPPDPERKDYHEWNAQTLRELHACMALKNCGPNQTKVALLASHWFEEAIVRGWRGGEGVFVCRRLVDYVVLQEDFGFGVEVAGH